MPILNLGGGVKTVSVDGRQVQMYVGTFAIPLTGPSGVVAMPDSGHSKVITVTAGDGDGSSIQPACMGICDCVTAGRSTTVTAETMRSLGVDDGLEAWARAEGGL